jgi:hypothetical protein
MALPAVIENQQNFLYGTIEEINGQFAKISITESQTILWPIDNLPNNTKTGEKIRLILHTDTTDEESYKKITKNILNEILKNNS